MDVKCEFLQQKLEQAANDKEVEFKHYMDKIQLQFQHAVDQMQMTQSNFELS